MKKRRAAVVLAAILILLACSDREDKDEDRGCGSGVGRRACANNQDCDGFSNFQLFGPSERCEVTSCGIDGYCRVDTITDTNLEDDVKGDCATPRCDSHGGLTSVFNRSDTKKSGTACRRIRCQESSFFTGGEENEADGVRCTMPTRSVDGVCENGICVETVSPPFPPPPPQDAGSTNDSGSEVDAGDASAPDAGD